MVSQSAYEFFANFDRTLIGARGEQFVIGQANPVPLCSLSARMLHVIHGPSLSMAII